MWATAVRAFCDLAVTAFGGVTVSVPFGTGQLATASLSAMATVLTLEASHQFENMDTSTIAKKSCLHCIRQASDGERWYDVPSPDFFIFSQCDSTNGENS